MRYQIFKLVGELAIADGKPAPIIKKQARAGKDLNWHLAQIEAEGENHLLYEEDWDYVVIQEYSTGPTSINPQIGPEKFLANVLQLYDYVAQSSPKAKIVMYETWARPVAQVQIYTDGYTIEKMQEELHLGYALAAEKINEKAGQMIAKTAPAGQVWKKYGWDPTLYGGRGDGTKVDYHQGPKGALINAMTLYATIYNEQVADLSPEHVQKIVTHLTMRAEKTKISPQQCVTEKNFFQLATSVDEIVVKN